MPKRIFILIFMFFCLIGQSQSHTGIKSVKIGTQVWMAQNLNVQHFRNGDPILYAKTEAEWKQAAKNQQPAWCYFNDDSTDAATHGRIYNWYAVNDPRGLAPIGWHVPDQKEWEMLFNQLGGRREAGRKLKTKNGWTNDGNGSNEVGFFAYASGRRTKDCRYTCKNIWGIWWTATAYSDAAAWSVGIVYLSDGISVSEEHNKFEGLSVRCVKD